MGEQPDMPRLLEPDEPSSVRVLREHGGSDLLLTADHAGRAIPRGLGRLGVAESELERHIAWDIGIAGVTEHLSAALDATAVLQTYSRLVIDCNRDPAVASSIPEVSETTSIPGNRNLSAAGRAARQREIFAPYHARISGLLDARQAAERRTVYVAMHSFTPVFRGEPRAMQVGVLYNRDARLANIMLDLLRAEGDLVVGDNAPYAVSDVTDYGVPVHAERRGLPHVEIEIRQDLIADVAGQAEWATRFTRLLLAADARLCGGEDAL
jgi:predicted N-formylglutamate amidohydrolase